MSSSNYMTDSTYDVNLRSPNTATINLATFYDSIRLDATKRIGLFNAGLIAFVVKTADYDQNILVPWPSNVRPQLAAGAKTAAATTYSIYILDYQSLAASLLITSKKILHGVSPATQTVMNEHTSSHPDFFRKPWAMMDFVFY